MIGTYKPGQRFAALAAQYYKDHSWQGLNGADDARESARRESHVPPRRRNDEPRGLHGEPLYLPNVEWDFAKKHEGAWKVLPE